MAELRLPEGDNSPQPLNRIDASVDLPLELQSKLFEQLATMGVAGAGLVITLRGSILSDASAIIWLGAVEFGLAAMIALAAQINFIEGLFEGMHSRRTSRLMMFLAVLLIGMGIGTLGTSVFLSGDKVSSTQTDPKSSR